MTADHSVFLAVDVETANADPASICWLGLALFRDGELAQTWSRAVDSGQALDPDHMSMQGLTRKDMKKAVPMRAVMGPLHRLTDGRVVVSFTAFEKVALALAAEQVSRPRLNARWLDVSDVARQSWEEVALRGDEIAGLCKAAGVTIEEPLAPLDKAVACGRIMAAACRESGLSPQQWYERISTTDIWDAEQQAVARRAESG